MVEIDEVEDGIAAAIEALDASAWAQGDATVATWRRCEVPLTARADERLRAHLSYSVSIEDLAAVGPGDDVEIPVTGTVEAVVYFRVRPPHATDDLRKAARGARAVLGAMLRAHGTPQDAGAWETWPTQVFRPGPIEGGEWYPVSIRCGVGFLLPVSIAPHFTRT